MFHFIYDIYETFYLAILVIQCIHAACPHFLRASGREVVASARSAGLAMAAQVSEPRDQTAVGLCLDTAGA